jgi:hypothetical protein
MHMGLGGTHNHGFLLAFSTKHLGYLGSLASAHFYHQISVMSIRYSALLLSTAAGQHMASAGSSWVWGSLEPTPNVSS